MLEDVDMLCCADNGDDDEAGQQQPPVHRLGCRLGGEEAVLDTKRPLLATGGRGLRLGQAGQPIWRMVMVRGGCHQHRPPPLSSPGGTLQGTHKYLPHWVKYHKMFHCNDEMTSKLQTHTDYAAHSD